MTARHSTAKPARSLELGFVSAVLPEFSLEQVLAFARDEGFSCVEPMCWPVGKAERKFAGVTHIDVTAFSRLQAEEIQTLSAAYKIRLSGLGYYPNPLDPDPAAARRCIDHLRRVIVAAEMLGLSTVNTFVGRDWTRTVDENWPRFLKTWRPLLALAEDHGVRIGIENCPMFFTRDEWPGGKNLATTPVIWRRMFHDIPSRNFGLNYDPSHFVLQQMDPARTRCEWQPGCCGRSFPERTARRNDQRRAMNLALKSLFPGRWVVCLVSLALLHWCCVAAPVTLLIRDAANGQAMPGRFHVKDAGGKPQRAGNLPFWYDHFVCDGSASLDLPPGAYTFEAERGPEFTSAQGRFTVVEGAATNVVAALARIAYLDKEDWWSGETHVHRPLADAELLMRAEDLHVAQFITWWNKVNLWTNAPLPALLPVQFDHDRFYHPLAGEDERDGGALLLFDLKQPLDLLRASRYLPPSHVYGLQAKLRPGAWIDLEKPFWWDLPMWVAHDLGHTIGIANNHQNRSGMLDNEAWGKPRDRAAFPGPQGNGLWTQQIYYHLLNCGLRLPPSAGSASGVLPNPVGYNRAYVRVEGELTYEKWCEGLRAGRSFVSNGPLLRCRANGQWPGHVFTANDPLQIRLEGRLDSREPIAAIERVHDGRIERVQLPATFTVYESGWFLVRAIAAVTNTFRFASTAPWYVEIGGRTMRPHADSAAFFVDWCRERTNLLEQIPGLTPDQKMAVLQPWQRTAAYWRDRALAAGTRVTGEIVDATSGQRLPARLYIQSATGDWSFAGTGSSEGSALRYDRQNWINSRAVEKHVTLSAHPFQIDLWPGDYWFVAEHGKEFFPLTNRVSVGRDPVRLLLPLRRWVDLAGQGWYSGDTHVHRDPKDLPNLMLAEDVNVVFPMAYWTTVDDVPPNRSPKSMAGEFPAQPFAVDATHIYYPRNTEYEIFTTSKRQHTLGALLAVNHRTVLDLPALPIRRVAERVHAEGGLLDLEKHNWEWSMALVPICRPDLYELANNHLWRTEFGITNWAVPAPGWMNVGTGSGNDREWASYGFQNYYALLDCGFRLRPCAGTAHGVHPVPLGFGRVYVHLDGPFSYQAWMEGLGAGRSFVTTGPMLLATFDGADPGRRFERSAAGPYAVTIKGTVRSEAPVTELELIANGERSKTIPLVSKRTKEGAFEAAFEHRESLTGSSWVAVRCWEDRGQGKVRFAHTGPVYFEVPGLPLRPRRAEVEFLADRVRQEIERSRALLPKEALAEFEEALRAYEELKAIAR